MVHAEIVEAVLQALARGTPVVGFARQFGLDPKPVRAWRTRGAYRFGQARCWIGEARVAAQVFVCTLGYSRRVFAVAFPRQRLTEFLAGHELAFQHFGGVPDRVVVDHAKALVLQHTRAATVWHPGYADVAAHYGVRPWACWPYRPQTKGKVESAVKYVQRNALAGKRFGSWEGLNG